MGALATIDRHLQQSQPKHLEKLKQLLRIPSVSADPGRKSDVEAAARLVLDTLEQAGLKTEWIETDGPPLLYAESPPVPGKPVALVYGHYDVQPADPLDLWVTPPFEPAEREGNLFARGATDDKGQMLTHVHSVASWAASGEPLPIQVKFLIEGEEEVGSQQLEAFLAKPESAEKLDCDVIVISDSSQYAEGQPAITYGLRGIAYFELLFKGPKQDLHSGSFGGAVANPAIALSKLLAAMIDDEGRIQLPGFYDSVKPLEQTERDAWSQLDFSEPEFAAQVGVAKLAGEADFTTLERKWARPTFDVNGLWSGYQGEGAKTIIPAEAGAKISFRLVPNQTPAEVAKQLEQFVAQHQFPGIEINVRDLQGGRGVVVDPHSPYIAAAQAAIAEGFGKQAVLIREGGSIPIVAEMVEKLDAAVLLLGWGLNDDNAHSPNEKFKIDDYFRGIRASTHLWQQLSSVSA